MEKSTSSCCTRTSRRGCPLLGGVALLASLAGATPLTVLAAPEPLMTTGSTWAGGDIVYPAGDPEVSAVILRIAEGEEPPWHCHPVPTMGYVLRGELEVQTQDGKTAVFREGDAVVEVLRTVHRGRALQAPVEVVVFYAGASGVPTTVLPGEDPGGTYCDPAKAPRDSGG